MIPPSDNAQINSNEDNLPRYQKDGIDLSPTVNQGQHIADLRNLADVPIAELASACDISDNELLAIEAGMQQLDPAIAANMAKHLGVRYHDLWIDPDNPT